MGSLRAFPKGDVSREMGVTTNTNLLSQHGSVVHLERVLDRDPRTRWAEFKVINQPVAAVLHHEARDEFADEGRSFFGVAWPAKL